METSYNKPLLLEILDFLKIRKKWWLLPIFIMLLLFGIFLFIGNSSSLSPILYALG